MEEDAGGKDFANPSAKSGSLGTVPTSRKVAQIDLVPTVSLLLGTPIPFGSLGGIIPELFSGRYAFEAAERDGEIGQEEEGVEGDMGDDPRHIERLCDALLVNSLQVKVDMSCDGSITPACVAYLMPTSGRLQFCAVGAVVGKNKLDSMRRTKIVILFFFIMFGSHIAGFYFVLSVASLWFRRAARVGNRLDMRAGLSFSDTLTVIVL